MAKPVLSHKGLEISANSRNDFWHDLPDTVKLQIDNAITQLDQGQGILHEDIMTAAKERFLNNTCHVMLSGRLQ